MSSPTVKLVLDVAITNNYERFVTKKIRMAIVSKDVVV